MPDGHVYAGYLAKVLLDHYARVYSTFTGKELTPGAPLESLTHSAPKLRQNATEQASLILNTIDRDLAAAHMTEMATKSAPGPIETKKKRQWSAVITAIVRRVRRGIKQRIPTMSNVNTNGVAEAARGEAVRQWQYDHPDEGLPVYKRWVTKQDEKVRASHVAMHGMMERVQDNFTVSGWQMNQPGDTSYGAPLEEVINCRCWTETYQRIDDLSVPEEQGTYEQIDITTPSLPTRTPRRPGAPLGSNIPNNPTSAITFAGRPTRARIVLGNGETATVTAGNGAFTVRVGRRVIAEASLLRDADGMYRLGAGFDIDNAYRLSGVEQFIRNSVTATNQMLRATP